MSGYQNKPKRRPPARPVAKAINQHQFAKERFLAPDSPYHMLLGCMVLVVAARLLVGVVTQDVRHPTQVGDMLDFHADQVLLTDPDTAVSAQAVAGPWARPSRACTLDIAEMAKLGGETTVTATQPGGVILSWVGGPTAPGFANCAGNPQIFVTNSGYARLQAAQKPIGPPKPR